MQTSNRELALKWVEVLRRPETNQTRHQLKSITGAVCALGALCQAAVELGMGRWDADGRSVYVSNDGERSPENYPTTDLSTAFGNPEDCNILVPFDGAPMDVYRLNDSLNLTLPQIADLIEKGYEL